MFNQNRWKLDFSSHWSISFWYLIHKLMVSNYKFHFHTCLGKTRKSDCEPQYDAKTWWVPCIETYYPESKNNLIFEKQVSEIRNLFNILKSEIRTFLHKLKLELNKNFSKISIRSWKQNLNVNLLGSLVLVICPETFWIFQVETPEYLFPTKIAEVRSSVCRRDMASHAKSCIHTNCRNINRTWEAEICTVVFWILAFGSVSGWHRDKDTLNVGYREFWGSCFPHSGSWFSAPFSQ